MSDVLLNKLLTDKKHLNDAITEAIKKTFPSGTEVTLKDPRYKFRGHKGEIGISQGSVSQHRLLCYFPFCNHTMYFDLIELGVTGD